MSNIKTLIPALAYYSAYCPKCSVCISWRGRHNHFPAGENVYIFQCLAAHKEYCCGNWEIKKEENDPN